jgi:hypothetical protein
MTNFIDSKTYKFEEAANQHVWRDVMVEEKNSIMTNDVREIVSRPEGKSIVTSKWILQGKSCSIWLC